MKTFLYALRYLTQTPTLQAVKVVSLTLGLTVGLLIFAKMSFENSYDNFFPDDGRVYQMKGRFDIDDGMGAASVLIEDDMLFGPMAPAMREAFPQVEAATRTAWLWGREYFHDDEFFDFQTIAGDSCLFDVLDYGMLSGDPKRLGVRDYVLISETAAQAMFGGDDPVGKTILYEKRIPLTVGGVFRDVPRNSQVRFDVIVSLEYVDELSGWGDANSWDSGDSFRIYAKLRPGASVAELEQQIAPFWAASPVGEFLEQWNATLFFRPIAESHRYQEGGRQISLLLAVLIGLVLFISAMNYVLISISSLDRRTRTIAVQKCSGARTRHIFGQFLIETALLILFSLLLAASLLVLLRQPVHDLTGETLATLFSGRQLWVMGGIVAGFFLLAGIIPGYIFSRIPVTQAFKASAPDKRWWKQLLLFSQVLFTTFVLIFLLIAVRQYRLVADKDMGYEYERVAVVQAKNIGGTEYRRIRQELLSEPFVEAVSYSYFMLTEGLSGMPVTLPGTDEFVSSRVLSAGPGFLELMGVQLISGESFTEESSRQGVIVNEKLAGALGWDGDPVGREIVSGERRYGVVGVVRDFHTCGSASQPVLPLAIHPYPMDGDTSRLYTPEIHVRLHEASPENLNALRESFQRLLPNQRVYLKTYTDEIYKTAGTERMIRNLVAASAAIIFLITLTGLIGYMNDEARRRRREIAIRRIHGATVRDVIGVVGRRLLIIGAAAIVCGTAAAGAVATGFVSNFPIQVTLAAWTFAAGALLVFTICVATIVIRVRRAASENPAETIKTE